MSHSKKLIHNLLSVLLDLFAIKCIHVLHFIPFSPKFFSTCFSYSIKIPFQSFFYVPDWSRPPPQIFPFQISLTDENRVYNINKPYIHSLRKSDILSCLPYQISYIFQHFHLWDWQFSSLYEFVFLHFVW